jgi:hypothetical protein
MKEKLIWGEGLPRPGYPASEADLVFFLYGISFVPYKSKITPEPIAKLFDA